MKGLSGSGASSGNIAISSGSLRKNKNMLVKKKERRNGNLFIKKLIIYILVLSL